MLHRRLAAAALVLVGLTACQPAVRPFTDADRTAIRASIDAYLKAALAADWDSWGKLFAEDAIAMPPNGPPLVGRAAIVAYAKAYPKLTRFTATVEEANGVGDMAWVRVRYSLAATLPNGVPITEDGSSLEIRTRAADGTWPYARLIWHSDAPLAAPAPAPPPRRGR